MKRKVWKPVICAVSVVAAIVAVAVWRSTPSQPDIDINLVLQRWSEGHRDEAVRSFLHLAEMQTAESGYRPYDFSEEYFLSLPQTNRDQLHEEMLETFDALRGFIRELDRRVKASLEQGDQTTAKKFIVAMKRLGEANTGPQVTRVSGLMGKAITTRADELAQLDKGHTAETINP